MKTAMKKGLSLFFAILILLMSSVGASAANAEPTSPLSESATETEIQSTDGTDASEADAETKARAASIFPAGSASVNVSLDGMRVLDGEAVIINSVTYVPLRKFCDLVGNFDISWNDKTKTATVKNDKLVITVKSGAIYISANDRCFYTVEKVLNLGGLLYVPVRPLSKALSLSLSWNAATRTVELKDDINSVWLVYNQDDLYWLARIINAEAGAEPMEGKMAVGNVVLNRVKHKSYPNSIYGVIFDRKHGIQFTPAVTGTIYKTPNADSIRAAKMCLEGYTITSDALFFINPKIATNFWIVNNCKYCFTIGNHSFYK